MNRIERKTFIVVRIFILFFGLNFLSHLGFCNTFDGVKQILKLTVEKNYQSSATIIRLNGKCRIVTCIHCMNHQNQGVIQTLATSKEIIKSFPVRIKNSLVSKEGDGIIELEVQESELNNKIECGTSDTFIEKISNPSAINYQGIQLQIIESMGAVNDSIKIHKSSDFIYGIESIDPVEIRNGIIENISIDLGMSGGALVTENNQSWIGMIIQRGFIRTNEVLFVPAEEIINWLNGGQSTLFAGGGSHGDSGKSGQSNCSKISLENLKGKDEGYLISGLNYLANIHEKLGASTIDSLGKNSKFISDDSKIVRNSMDEILSIHSNNSSDSDDRKSESSFWKKNLMSRIYGNYRLGFNQTGEIRYFNNKNSCIETPLMKSIAIPKVEITEFFIKIESFQSSNGRIFSTHQWSWSWEQNEDNPYSKIILKNSDNSISMKCENINFLRLNCIGPKEVFSISINSTLFPIADFHYAYFNEQSDIIELVIAKMNSTQRSIETY